MKPAVFFFPPSLSSSFPSFAPVPFSSYVLPPIESTNVTRHDSHIITDLCCLADIQRDVPAARTLKLSLSLMMDQKASLLISGIGRRDGTGHMLEPSVLHLEMRMITNCGRNRDSSNQTPFNECYMPNPVHHRTA